MKKNLNLIPRLMLISLGLFLFSHFVEAKPPVKIEKKTDKVLKKHFKKTDFSKLEIIYNPKDVSFKPANTTFYKLLIDKSHSGYLYVDEAFGRYDGFYFMFITDNDFKIEFVSVLSYNSDHGGEITNKKWLEQFVGFTPDSEIKYKDNIDAISGATISCKSITEAVSFGLKKFVELKEKGAL